MELLTCLKIADEKHWMMSLFCLYQCAIIFVTLVVLVELTDTSDLWITLTVYACVSVVIALLTLYISVRCQMNFNRGLKPYGKRGEGDRQVSHG
ncbi:hypothetical protein BCR43DRAFT_30441 [Syncephalastrum racemosum]|uniref:Uncharacterized protein n=1 Tax=Syncephalastrum racemosum TaxID=13706 RepID=A0A1X2HTT7_SYNRA|nr:hypothetical protein BCR43DRAFT_30441 [Syncephalastrum racemosum]